MGSLTTRRRLLLEGLPIASLMSSLGIVLDVDLLKWAAWLPVAAWLGAAALTVVTSVQEAREAGDNEALAVVRGLASPLVGVVRSYWRLGLWRGRGVYDLVALVAFAASGSWWVLHAMDHKAQDTVRWLCIVPLLAAAVAIALRVRTRREAPALLTDVTFALDTWQHKRRRGNELAYENAIADHLHRLGFDVAQGTSLEAGREADIVVRPKGRAGAWDWRDVMIEMKAHMTKTTERDRAMGQLETYFSQWPGAIILMICGDYRRDLVEPLSDKVSDLRNKGRPAAMILKGRQLE